MKKAIFILLSVILLCSCENKPRYTYQVNINYLETNGKDTIHSLIKDSIILGRSSIPVVFLDKTSGKDCMYICGSNQRGYSRFNGIWSSSGKYLIKQTDNELQIVEFTYKKTSYHEANSLSDDEIPGTRIIYKKEN